MMDDTAAVDGIAGYAIRVPGDDAFRVTALDSGEHLIEDGPTRAFGAVSLFVRADDLNIGMAAESSLEFRNLGVDGEDLAGFGVFRLPTIDEVLHTYMYLHNHLRW